jgi:type 1 glutamine amidotransferase
MRTLLSAALGGLVCFPLTSITTLAEPVPAVVVLQSRGYVHDVTRQRNGGPSVVEQVIRGVAQDTGTFAPRFTYDASELTADALADTRLVVFYTTGDLPMSVDDLDAWVRGGGRFFGIHSATDTFKDNETYRKLIGAIFRDHPWNAGDTVTLRADDPDHPAAAPYAPTATFREEIYRFRAPLPDDAHVLISLDRAATPKKVEGDEIIPIAWQRTHGDGRVFYTSLGHREDVWRSEAFQAHLRGAVDWLFESGGPGGPRGADEPVDTHAVARPVDPWVFRSILDGNPRIITVALHDDLWIAYDPDSMALHQAWRGGVKLQGAVYDGRHGPQPVTEADRVYYRRSDSPIWLLDDQPVTPRYRGYRLDEGRVTIAATVPLPDGGEVWVRQTPAFVVDDDRVILRRDFEIIGLPAGTPLVVPLVDAGSGAHGSSRGVGSIAADKRTLQAGHALLQSRDGRTTVDTSWTRGEQP